MPQIRFINTDGFEMPVDVRPGITLLEAAQNGGVPILGTCGGSMICATCHVLIDGAGQGKLPAPSEDELVTLELAHDATGDSRLACQLEVCDTMEGIVVRLAPTMNSA